MALIDARETDEIEARAAADADSQAAILTAICEGHEVSDVRRETLTRAIELGADRKTLVVLRDAVRVNRASTIVLPQGRFANLSRGRGWCRKGKGASAEWADADEHRVGPGKWVVGSSDGFSRKQQTPWTVEHVQVGAQTWTVAR